MKICVTNTVISLLADAGQRIGSLQELVLLALKNVGGLSTCEVVNAFRCLGVHTTVPTVHTTLTRLQCREFATHSLVESDSSAREIMRWCITNKGIEMLSWVEECRAAVQPTGFFEACDDESSDALRRAVRPRLQLRAELVLLAVESAGPNADFENLRVRLSGMVSADSIEYAVLKLCRAKNLDKSGPRNHRYFQTTESARDALRQAHLERWKVKSQFRLR